MRSVTYLSILLSFSILTPLFAQSGAKTATITQIEAYSKAIDKMTDRRKEPDIVIADVSDYDEEKPRWRKFKSTSDLDAFRENSETYSIAYNWRTKSNITSSVLTLFSPSGDWAQYLTHYFRPDGTAAKVTTEMRTFNGDYIIIREMYFDQRGKLLKKSSKYLDLTTQKPKKPTKEMLVENSDFFKAEYYKKVSALPFYSLTKIK